MLAAGIPVQAPGVMVGEDSSGALQQVIGLLAKHRVWERFPAGV
ncbi:hypothetical protein [Streptomyces himalayensis]|uniref:Large catalase C-terminal domain-containing protein n=1 Tax=Streptomyces himalayensis subsp. himalayensis TaxID=2756131 RepID=A0A7W0IDF0_9ACTN|nr:hypothetical protein [Streptomyces himalayensis]MBA2951740.1 hypothetical protein [Streptomyces himalayensis subsp. himalayensis]